MNEKITEENLPCRLEGLTIVIIFGLLLGIICLSLFSAVIWRAWAPALKNHSILAAHISYPLAQDFPLHWTASLLTLSGTPSAVYDFNRLRSLQNKLTGSGPLRWAYPPSALLLDLPLALVPYLVSLFLWLTLTLALYLLVLYYIARHPVIIFWSLSFFGTFANFFQGQNGFFSAALFGAGLLLLERKPLLSGILLGLMSYKPHLAALIPLALVAGGQWRALAGAIISGTALILISAFLFGIDTWRLFLENISSSMATLQTDNQLYAKIPSVYTACRLAGFDQSISWLCHGLAMSLAIFLVIRIWSDKVSLPLRAASLLWASLLFSPYIWFYDSTLLAVALAWLWREDDTNCCFSKDILLWLWCWAAPLLSFFLSVDLKIPCSFIYLLPPFFLLLQRYRHQHDKILQQTT